MVSVQLGVSVGQALVRLRAYAFSNSRLVDDVAKDVVARRIRFDHSYPDYFSQADSNPQPAFAYPNAALGEFRCWLTDVYLPTKFPKYLTGKVREGAAYH